MLSTTFPFSLSLYSLFVPFWLFWLIWFLFSPSVSVMAWLNGLNGFCFPFLAFHFSITEDIFLEVSIYILLRKMSLFIYRYINSRKTRFSEHDSILQQLRQLYAKSHAFVLIACIKLGFTSAIRRLASVMKQKQKKTFWKWFVEPLGLVYVSEVVDCSWKHC